MIFVRSANLIMNLIPEFGQFSCADHEGSHIYQVHLEIVDLAVG